MIVDPMIRPPTIRAMTRPSAKKGEEIHCNARWARVEPVLSVLVPVYKYDSTKLISALSECEFAKQVELILYDDGSDDAGLSEALKVGIDAFKGAGCVVTAAHNIGRSGGRNRLETLARSNWMLFLDSDMIPDDRLFLRRYMSLIEQYGQPILVVGGFSLQQAEKTSTNALHWHQCAQSECVPAEERQTNPGRYVFTSNVLVHKDIMAVVPFDHAFEGWGWEDVDWGLRAARRFPVLHIDNTATHVGLDTASTLIRKYAQSGPNFWLVASRHPDALKQTGLYRIALILSYIPGRSLIKWISNGLARLPVTLMPARLTLFFLKLFRASVYAEARNVRS